jgi:hypothetical protein
LFRHLLLQIGGANIENPPRAISDARSWIFQLDSVNPLCSVPLAAVTVSVSVGGRIHVRIGNDGRRSP